MGIHLESRYLLRITLYFGRGFISFGEGISKIRPWRLFDHYDILCRLS